MLTVYKYELYADHGFRMLEAPEIIKPLSVGFDVNGQLCIWLLVNPETKQRKYACYVAETGKDIRGQIIHGMQLIGKAETFQNDYICHVWLDMPFST